MRKQISSDDWMLNLSRILITIGATMLIVSIILSK